MDALIHIIGLIVDGRGNTLGYRLYNYITRQVSDIQVQNFIETLKSGRAKVEGINVIGNRVKAQYNLIKLPRIYTDDRHQNVNLDMRILITTIEDNAIIADYLGNLTNVLINELHKPSIACKIVNTNALDNLPKITDNGYRNKLNELAVDPDVYWSLIDFTDYMKLNGYYFELFHEYFHWYKLTNMKSALFE